MGDNHDVILLAIGMVLFGVGVLIGLNIVSAINNRQMGGGHRLCMFRFRHP